MSGNIDSMVYLRMFTTTQRAEGPALLYVDILPYCTLPGATLHNM